MACMTDRLVIAAVQANPTLGAVARNTALARERILTWYADQAGAGDLSRWPRREREMFERRRDDIRQALGYGK